MAILCFACLKDVSFIADMGAVCGMPVQYAKKRPVTAIARYHKVCSSNDQEPSEGSIFVFKYLFQSSPDSESYRGPYFKYRKRSRKRCLCALWGLNAGCQVWMAMCALELV